MMPVLYLVSPGPLASVYRYLFIVLSFRYRFIVLSFRYRFIVFVTDIPK